MWAAPLAQGCLPQLSEAEPEQEEWTTALSGPLSGRKLFCSQPRQRPSRWLQEDVILSTCGGKRRGAEEECRAGDLHREEEYKVGKRGKEEQNQGGRAARKVNPAVSINHFRNAEMSQSEVRDQFHLWYQSIDVSRQPYYAVGFDHFNGANFVPFRNTFSWYSTDFWQPIGLGQRAWTLVCHSVWCTRPGSLLMYNVCSSLKHNLLMHHTLCPLLYLGRDEHKRLLKSVSSITLISTSALNQTSG